MEFEEVVRARRSIRSYRPDPVPMEEIESILAIAGLAPSSHNLQPWRFHIATGAARDRAQDVLVQTTRYLGEYLETLTPEDAELAEEFFADLGHAPVLIGVSVEDTDNESDRINALLAVGCAVQNLQLAATARGLGSCAITFSYWVRDELAGAMGVEHGRSIVTVVLLGKPAEEPEPTDRRKDIATFIE